MNRDEILEMSRRENKNRDEMELQAQANAGRKACLVGGLMCAAIILLEGILADRVSMGTWAVYLSITGTMLLTKYFWLKKKHELIFGLLQIVLAAVFFAIHISRLVR